MKFMSKPGPADIGDAGSAAAEREANRVATFQHLNDIVEVHGFGKRWTSVRCSSHPGVQISRPLTERRSLIGGWRL